MQYMTDGVLLRETLRDADLDQYRYYTCSRFVDEFSCMQHQLLWQMHNYHLFYFISSCSDAIYAW